MEQASSTENSPERNFTDDMVESDHSVSPPPSQTDDMQSSSVQDDVTYDHQAAHIAAIPGRIRNSPSPTARMSFFDEEYVQGRRVPSPPPTTMELDFEPESAVNHVRNNIVRMLAQKSWLPDFKEHRVPSMQRDPQVHQELSALLSRRREIDKELMDMLSDRDEDGKPLDPKRDFEADYR